jgi:hypothetical protein
MRLVFAVAAAIMLLIAPSRAATYFVGKTSCSDSFTPSQATVSTTPWCSVAHAISIAVAGDTMLMENGTYNEAALSFNTNGTSGNPITLQAQNQCTGLGIGGTPSCSAIINSSANCTPAIGVSASYITLRGFEITDTTGVCGMGYSSRNNAIRMWGENSALANPTTPSASCQTSVFPSCNTPSSQWTNTTIDGLYIPDSSAFDITIKNNGDFTELKNSLTYGPLESFDNERTRYHNNVIHSGSCFIGNRFPPGFPGECNDDMIEVKGGIRDMRIDHNILYGTNDAQNAMSLGSGSQAYSVDSSGNVNTSPPLAGQKPGLWWDNDAHIECYNCIADNNIIVDLSPDAHGLGLVMRGAQNSGFYNNTLIGWVQIAFQQGCENNCGGSTGGCYGPPTATTNGVCGAGARPYPINPSYVNNIWYGNNNPWTTGFFGGVDTSSTSTCNGSGCTGTQTFDHNTMYNYAVASAYGANHYPAYATNISTANPNFVNPASDWHLQAGSPTIGAAIAQTPAKYVGGTFDISLDFAGASRGSSSPWDQGVYVFASNPVTASLLVNGTSSVTIASGGSASLTWSSVGATSCTGTNFSTGGSTADGSPVTVSPTITTTYSIDCTDGTNHGTSSVTVTVTNGTLWYVDNSVGSSGSGSSASPWKDFTNIVWGGSGVLPGDTIYISGGSTSQTYTSQIVPTAGGSTGNPITITADTRTGHNGQVIIDGGVNPGVFPIQIGVLNDFIIQNLTVQNDGDAAIWVNGSTAGTTIIQNVKIHTGVGPTNGTAWGIRLQNNAGAVNILNSIIDTPASSTSAASTAGISLQANTGLVTISGNQILENNASNGQGGGGAGNDCIDLFKTGNTIITDNFLSHVNGGANNLGINIDSMTAGTNALVSNNVIYMPVGDAIANNFSMSQAGFTGTMSFYNNTTYGNGSSYLMTITAAGATLKNNIFDQVGSGFGVYATAAITADYDLIYAPAGTVGVISGVNKTWAAWQTAGNDTHGVNANPLFTTVANAAGGFALQSGSPALDVGTTLAQVPTDYLGVVRPQGTAYDMGAFERVVSGGGGASAAPMFLLLGAGR